MGQFLLVEAATEIVLWFCTIWFPFLHSDLVLGLVKGGPRSRFDHGSGSKSWTWTRLGKTHARLEPGPTESYWTSIGCNFSFLQFTESNPFCCFSIADFVLLDRCSTCRHYFLSFSAISDLRGTFFRPGFLSEEKEGFSLLPIGIWSVGIDPSSPER
ncbi:hypothetical protein SAY87_025881 [Trapa incisa]|uniref:Uncharacterized protein n=1 Tax=Trapa incisa TaxID=236973 RepID=A0AAN7JJH7_9MYRT|nr:hypothetical protein SAY87_025881 [Trapa incisa]